MPCPIQLTLFLLLSELDEIRWASLGTEVAKENHDAFPEKWPSKPRLSRHIVFVETTLNTEL